MASTLESGLEQFVAGSAKGRPGACGDRFRRLDPDSARSRGGRIDRTTTPAGGSPRFRDFRPRGQSAYGHRVGGSRVASAGPRPGRHAGIRVIPHGSAGGDDGDRFTVQRPAGREVRRGTHGGRGNRNRGRRYRRTVLGNVRDYARPERGAFGLRHCRRQHDASSRCPPVLPCSRCAHDGHVHRRNKHGRGPRRIRYAPARAEPVVHVAGSAGDLGRDGHPGAGTVAPGGKSVAAPADRNQGIHAPTVASSVDSRRIVRPPVDRVLRESYLARASV